MTAVHLARSLYIDPKISFPLSISISISYKMIIVCIKIYLTENKLKILNLLKWYPLIISFLFLLSEILNDLALLLYCLAFWKLYYMSERYYKLKLKQNINFRKNKKINIKIKFSYQSKILYVLNRLIYHGQSASNK